MLVALKSFSKSCQIITYWYCLTRIDALHTIVPSSAVVPNHNYRIPYNKSLILVSMDISVNSRPSIDQSTCYLVDMAVDRGVSRN